MGNGAVRVRIEADTSGLRQGVDQASHVLETFGKGTQRAERGGREFASVLTLIAGEAGGATKAVGSLLGGFAAGGVMGLAIGGVHALVESIVDVRKEAAETAKKAAEHAAEIGKKMAEAATDIARARFVAGGGSAADFNAIVEARKKEAEAQKELTRRTEEYAQAKEKVRQQQIVVDDPRMAGPYAKDMKAAAERELAAFKAIEEEKKRAVQEAEGWIANLRQGAVVQVEKTTKEAAEKGNAAATQAAEERWRREHQFIEEADAHVRAYYEHQKKEMDDLAAGKGSSGFEEEGARSTEYYALKLADARKEQDQYNRSVEQSRQASLAWGEAAGGAMAAVVTGQMSLGQAVASMLQMMIREATAYAVAAAVGAAKSQSPIPVVGPALGIAAAGSMLATLMGMIASMPGRAMGGRVLAGLPYLTGEEGPEVVIPDRSGTVVPNHRLQRGGGGGPNFYISALDPRGVGAVITSSDGEVRRALRKMERRRR